jgi:uncharacterized membrane protein YgcG
VVTTDMSRPVIAQLQHFDLHQIKVLHAIYIFSHRSELHSSAKLRPSAHGTLMINEHSSRQGPGALLHVHTTVAHSGSSTSSSSGGSSSGGSSSSSSSCHTFQMHVL